MNDSDPLAYARAVKAANEADLMALPNVVAVGIGLRDEMPAIIVSVERIVPANQLGPADRIPSEIDGVPVGIFESGPLVAGGS